MILLDRSGVGGGGEVGVRVVCGAWVAVGGFRAGSWVGAGG